MVAFTPNLQDVTLLSDAIKYITDELTNAFKCNQLQSVLKKYHYPVIEKTVETYFDASLPNGKILVLGSSSCSVRHLEATFKALGLSDRLEYCLDYKTLKNYKFEHLRNNHHYRLIIVGPMPHSTKGTDNYSSVITRMESSDEFPKVVRAMNNGELKITKSNVKAILTKEKSSGFIAA
ncbi:hypothetical protein [uncultured Veillonella sp.]|uniref:hypothetical protein n=1 Tax=uncultured Veillonella sp. TaxID=159268 RepID=UPI0026174058|nr:hypothetical protein [uncultured Veillonella sp.]